MKRVDLKTILFGPPPNPSEIVHAAKHLRMIFNGKSAPSCSSSTRSQALTPKSMVYSDKLLLPDAARRLRSQRRAQPAGTFVVMGYRQEF